jgi:hypothetical protein
VRSWNGSDRDRHREALAIVRSGALPDTGVFITTHTPRGEPGELGASRTVQVGPGRCVIGEEHNTIFVYAAGGWHLINPTDSSDPAMDVVNGAGDHPNADADVEGRITLAR